MHANLNPEAVKQVLHDFQAGYTARDRARVDDFMRLFHDSDEIELIGIGAAERGGREWFVGSEAIKEILLSDWEFWGDVHFDVAEAHITIEGQVAWVTMTGKLAQTDTHTKAMSQYASQMKDLILENDPDPEKAMLDAVHFGIRRLWERGKGSGHTWPFVLSAVLLYAEGRWKFHTIHWSMPVD